MDSIVYNEDCLVGMKNIRSESIDIILTDPPYLYLDHKLDRQFDEIIFFQECNRILKKGGFVIIFGRGTSFYRWNVLLDGLGFIFKEEIVWNKRRISSPALPLGRVHETISIHSKGNASIKESIVNYGELKAYDLDKIEADLKRLAGLFNKGKAYDKVIENLRKANSGESYSSGKTKSKNKLTLGSEPTNLHISTYTILALENGCKEQSIISDSASHYNNIHPAQKPVRLLERVLNLVIQKGGLVLDPFMGSQSTRIAAHNLGLDFIGFEIDNDWFCKGNKRFAEHTAQRSIF